eukprot:2665823-Rhodomonas_salina.1
MPPLLSPRSLLRNVRCLASPCFYQALPDLEVTVACISFHRAYEPTGGIILRVTAAPFLLHILLLAMPLHPTHPCTDSPVRTTSCLLYTSPSPRDRG